MTTSVPKRRLWACVSNSRNRAVLSWVGSGVVALIAGLWAVTPYVFPKKNNPAAPTVVCAQQGGVAAGRDVSGNTITVTAPGGSSGSLACADAPKR